MLAHTASLGEAREGAGREVGSGLLLRGWGRRAASAAGAAARLKERTCQERVCQLLNHLVGRALQLEQAATVACC